MTRILAHLTLFIAVIGIAGTVCAAPGEAVTDAEAAGPDYAVQGEYLGEVQRDNGGQPYGVQVIALGDDAFRAVVHAGGLPGEGFEAGGRKYDVEGSRSGGTVTFKADDGGSGTIEGDTLVIRNSGGDVIGKLKKAHRESKTLGKQPPEGAVVLFDGSSAEHLQGGRLVEGNLLAVGCHSKQEFQDFTLHLEFRTPFMPQARGQGRGNSGVYLQDRYEIQVLDSFGLEGKNNECGGIYGQRAPRLNMCYPPLAWQTYNVEFKAARFDDDGNKTSNARVTLLHNGVKIYDDVELPSITPGGASTESPGVGPLKLQDHGNPVHFRNIWVLEK